MRNLNWCYVEEAGAHGRLGNSAVPTQLQTLRQSESSSDECRHHHPSIRNNAEHFHDCYKMNYAFDRELLSF